MRYFEYNPISEVLPRPNIPRYELPSNSDKNGHNEYNEYNELELL